MNENECRRRFSIRFRLTTLLLVVSVLGPTIGLLGPAVYEAIKARVQHDKSGYYCEYYFSSGNWYLVGANARPGSYCPPLLSPPDAEEGDLVIIEPIPDPMANVQPAQRDGRTILQRLMLSLRGDEEGGSNQ